MGNTQIQFNKQFNLTCLFSNRLCSMVTLDVHVAYIAYVHGLYVAFSPVIIQVLFDKQLRLMSNPYVEFDGSAVDMASRQRDPIERDGLTVDQATAQLTSPTRAPQTMSPVRTSHDDLGLIADQAAILLASPTRSLSMMSPTRQPHDGMASTVEKATILLASPTRAPSMMSPTRGSHNGMASTVDQATTQLASPTRAPSMMSPTRDLIMEWHRQWIKLPPN